MLDLFTIFSKGGIVFWCFHGTTQSLTLSVNTLIKSVILQERGGLESFTHEALTMKYKLDNEFELVFVVAYQSFLQLSYVDKLLTDIQLRFRDMFRGDLSRGGGPLPSARSLDDLEVFFKKRLKDLEDIAKFESKQMRGFTKTNYTITNGSSEDKQSDNNFKKKKKNKAKSIKATINEPVVETKIEKVMQQKVEESCELDATTVQENLLKLKERMAPKKATKEPKKGSGDVGMKKVKQMREWEDAPTRNLQQLDFSNKTNTDGMTNGHVEEIPVCESMKGYLKDLDENDGGINDNEDDDDDDDGEDDDNMMTSEMDSQRNNQTTNKKSTFSFLKSLVTSKVLTREDIAGILEKMRLHLISKNVAAEIAGKLCDSVATKLEGKVLGTFKSVSWTVRGALEESCVQLLTPRKRIDILRDALDAKQQCRPYVIVFCGVNGVGKSTNLTKICYWLMENDLRIQIAACDTFRAGAVEQLRTHVRKLTSIWSHKNNNNTNLQLPIALYEKGYGKDAAGVAMEAIHSARDQRFDVVLVDTAGRMQGNEPLMRSLAKLIKVNQPDLVLFVGEALVGNDAVDQLVKFNQALADHSETENPHLIDGIVLTKFDTIDDKVGAAISMTYITGQPIVFVGTGQTYTDLKNLNVGSVVQALMK